ncbi:hypothetical protein ES703_31044 [subsurface metagenome]
MYKKTYKIIFFLLFFIPLYAPSLSAGHVAFHPYPLLKDYYSLIYGQYYQYYILQSLKKPILLYESPSDTGNPSHPLERLNIDDKDEELTAELNLEGEIDLNLRYGGDFSLKKDAVVGAGSSGITRGLEYDLIEKVILEGNVGERLYVEFDYDSERSEEGIAEESNTYSILYKGKNDEFLKEASLGNKYLSIPGSRYVPIDEGNPDSFALRAIAGWRNFYLEGLCRYEVATDGEKQFKGYKKNVDMKVPDIDYVKGKFFFIPDINIDEGSLEVYRTAEDGFDIPVDGKEFKLLQRGIDYDFDNTNGNIYLNDTLELSDELIVYYKKEVDSEVLSVGDNLLGVDAIIDSTDLLEPDDGGRVNFNKDEVAFSEYFDGSQKYLYLKKKEFNSYWELKNIYYLEELEGNVVYNLSIELLYTVNSGINSNYDSLLNNYEIDTERGIIKFNFSDEDFNTEGGFYPRPFPGEEPFSSRYTPPDPKKPFDENNPIYGGINYPTSENSINTIRIQYSYSAESFFLDFDLVPGSVVVTVNGVTLDPAYYDVDHDFGIITFSEDVIKPASDIVITYKYNPFGEGDKSLFSAIGLTYENDFFHAR